MEGFIVMRKKAEKKIKSIHFLPIILGMFLRNGEELVSFFTDHDLKRSHQENFP